MCNMNSSDATAAMEYCRKLANSHYENFTVASYLLPKVLRRPFYAVYAYCRISDDLADESGSPEAALKHLDDWQRQLDLCFDHNAAEHPVFVALREIKDEFQLEKKPFADLLVAFRQDQSQTRYENMSELLGYCRNSADPVGRIILQLGAVAAKTAPPNEEMLRYSDAICTALQLANFWQDVARDWKIGRLYVPLDYCQRFQFDPNSGRCDENQYREMMKLLVEDAKERFRFGKPLVKMVPKMLRTDVALFLGGGLAILEAIEKIDYDTLHHRPEVSRWKKFSLLLRSLLLR